MKSPLLLVFVLVLAWPSLAQESIRGRIIDRDSRKPVVGVHVIAFGNKIYGSTSNDMGEFGLHRRGEIDSIRMSCIGYKTSTLYPADFKQNPIVVLLEPHITSLEALTIRPPSPQELIRNAVAAIPRNYEHDPFQVRGFYREQIRNDSIYFSVAEAVFESQLLPGEDDGKRCKMRLVQGRRSETVKSTRMFEDYHPGGGPNYLMSHSLEVRLPPFMEQSNFKDYDYAVDSITSYEGMDVYVIGFDQRAGMKKNLWSGKLFIEAESFAIIAIDYALSDKGVEYRDHLTGTDKAMASLLGIDFEVLHRNSHFSYRLSGAVWAMHEARLSMDIHFRQPRKEIDERFTLKAEMLSLSQDKGPLTAFSKSELWHSNNLVQSLPGEFDEGFWGTDNYIQPEKSLTAAVAAMKTIKGETLATGPGGWQMFHPEMAKAYAHDSALMLKPYMESRWKDGERGPLLWKDWTGDFRAEARIRVTKSSDPSVPPDAGFQVGGIMARSDDGDFEDHIFVGLGAMGNPNMKLTCQNTIRSNSAIHVTRIAQHEARLRLTRTGDLFTVYYFDVETNQWKLWREINRNNMPQKLQIGIAGYAYVPGNAPNRKPDLLVDAQGLTIAAPVK